MQFFVSYSKADLKWAKWIVWELESSRQRHRCIVQFRDFAPGMNFIQQMRKAAEAECTLAIFSPSYFRSNYCRQELDAALTGKPNRLLPVKVRDCDPGAFLANRIFIDMTETSWDPAREVLLSGVEAYVTQTLGGLPGTQFRARPRFPGKAAPAPLAPVAVEPERSGPLKVLFVGSDASGLDPRGQLSAMQKSVAHSRFPDSLTFKGIFKTDIDTLFEGLNRELPDVFHFSGKQNGGDILMKTRDGSLMTVPDTALAGTFRSLDQKPKLVVIDTCYSLRCATTISRAVPCAMGVEGDPYEAEAVDFYKVFYQAIASGRSLKDAAGQARTALKLAKAPVERIPQLKCQSGVDPAKVFLVKRP